MYFKNCPKCGENSYSSSKKDKWRCPICKHNLTEISAQLTKNERKKKNYPNVDRR